jgi:hypothetical protein
VSKLSKITKQDCRTLKSDKIQLSYRHSREPPLTQGINMRSCVEEQWRLPLQSLTNRSGKNIYWGFFLSVTGSFGLGAS